MTSFVQFILPLVFSLLENGAQQRVAKEQNVWFREVKAVGVQRKGMRNASFMTAS